MKLICVLLLIASLIIVQANGEETILRADAEGDLEHYLCDDVTVDSNTELRLHENTTHLVSPGLFCVIRDLVNISIVGPAVIQCTGPNSAEEQSGFGFRNISGLTIRDINLHNCGGVLTVESYTFRHTPLIFAGPLLQAVIVLNSCLNVHLENIEVDNYRGYAILNLNVLGNSTFDRITIHNSHAFNLKRRFISESNFLQSGSGFLLYFIDNGYNESDNVLEGTDRHFVTVSRALIANNTNLFPPNLTHETTTNSIKQDDELLPLPLGGAGGLSCNFLQVLYNIQVDIVDSEITENTGSVSAGMLVIQKNTINHNLLNIHGCLFRNNTLIVPQARGAGIQFVFIFPFVRLAMVSKSAGEKLADHTVEIQNTVMRDHYAMNGAAIYATSTPQNISQVKIVLHNVSFINNEAERDADCIFVRGERSVYFFQSLLHLQLDHVRAQSRKQEIVGSTGAFTFINLGTVKINGTEDKPSIFEDGHNSAIAAFNTDVYLSGTVKFLRNTAPFGAALKLQDSSHLFLSEHVNVLFQENKATYGGAIFIEPASGPQCVIQIVTNDLSFNATAIVETLDSLTTIDLNVTFVNNTAILGSSIFGGPLYNCTGFPDSIVQLPTNVLDDAYNSLFSFWSGNESVPFLTQVRSVTAQICFCNKSASLFECTQSFPDQAILPGKEFTLQVAAVDDAKQPVGGIVESTLVNGGKGRFPSSGETFDLATVVGECAILKYSIIGVENITAQVQLSLQNINGHILTNINILPCPEGFFLSNNTGTCACIELYQDQGLTCNLTTGYITRTGLEWLGLVNISGVEEPVLVTTCPYGYCTFERDPQIDITVPSDICQEGRTGVLCGQCQEGLSAQFGTTDCGECNNFYLFTILLYALAGVLLIAALFVFNITVSSGTINGLVFYAQLVGTTLRIVGNSPLRPAIVFVSLLNLDIGFPLCFYDGMDQLGKIGLQFVFPVYIWLLVILIIIATQYSNRLQKIFGNNICVNVLVTLMYLSFAKVIRTVALILVPAVITTESGSWDIVWFFDGSVKYFTGVHVFLVLLAIVFGVLSMIYQLSFLLAHWFGFKVRRLSLYLKPVIDAHLAPFKDKYRYWLGLRLVFVGVFTILSISLSASNFTLLGFIHFIMLFLLTVTQAFISPFRFKAINILDLFFLANVTLYLGTQVFLVAITDERTVLGDKGNILVSEAIFVGSAVFVGIGILVYHIVFASGFYKACKKRIPAALKDKSKFRHSHEVTTSEVSLDSGPSTSVTNPLPRMYTQTELVRLRESLLED